MTDDQRGWRCRRRTAAQRCAWILTGAAAHRRQAAVVCVRLHVSTRIALTSVVALWIGCGPSAPAASYQAVTVAGGGTIDGVVKLSGAAPVIANIATTKDQDYCGKKAVSSC